MNPLPSPINSISSGDEAPLLAAIEAGGTKYVCAVARDPEHPLLEVRFPTRSPEETIAEAVSFFQKASASWGTIAAMGIGTFGPAEINPASPRFGSILTTPKAGWSDYQVIGGIRNGLGHDFPIAFETDVNAAVIGEASYGVAKDFRNVAYLTIGTGIGGAFLHEGTLIHGRMHPEVGHLLVPDLDADVGKSTNVCPFHSSCLEGRASGPAIEARWGVPGGELPSDHPAWDLQARYLAIGCLNLTAAWSPDMIILGGGVSQKPGLIERVRKEFGRLTGGYWALPHPDTYLQTPGLDQQAGIAGAFVLAQRLL